MNLCKYLNNENNSNNKENENQTVDGNGANNVVEKEEAK